MSCGWRDAVTAAQQSWASGFPWGQGTFSGGAFSKALMPKPLGRVKVC
jgi:hypothetical protein